MRLGIMLGYAAGTVRLPIDLVQEADRLGVHAVRIALLLPQFAIFLALPPIRLLGQLNPDLRIVCPPGHTGLRPPYLMSGSEPVDGADISLSHDGPWIAWAIRLDGSPSSREPSGHD